MMEVYLNKIAGAKKKAEEKKRAGVKSQHFVSDEDDPRLNGYYGERYDEERYDDSDCYAVIYDGTKQNQREAEYMAMLEDLEEGEEPQSE